MKRHNRKTRVSVAGGRPVRKPVFVAFVDVLGRLTPLDVLETPYFEALARARRPFLWLRAVPIGWEHRSSAGGAYYDMCFSAWCFFSCCLAGQSYSHAGQLPWLDFFKCRYNTNPAPPMMAMTITLLIRIDMDKRSFLNE